MYTAFLAVKVRHMKGLWGTPICAVEDNLERQMIWSAPTGEQYSCQYTPRGSGRYSANVNKHIPAIGIGKCEIDYYNLISVTSN